MDDKFWYEEPSILLDRFIDFFPSKRMSTAERLNSIVRLAIYITVVLMLMKGALWPLYITLIVMGLTLFIYKNTAEPFRPLGANEIIDEFGERCTIPTTQNPYMNVTIDEIQDNPDRAPACSPLNPMISSQIDDNFKKGHYRDIDDIFDKQASINFWTNASTTIPGDQNKFARWLFGDMPSCKEDSAHCGRTQHLSLRNQRQKFVDPVSGVAINPVGN